MKCKVCDNDMDKLLDNGGYVCPYCGRLEKPVFNTPSIEAMCRLSETLKKYNQLNIGDIVQHFKRETINKEDDPNKYLYIIRGFATHTETGEKLVIYQALYSPFETYARPKKMFFDKVDKDKYPDIKQELRFTLIKGLSRFTL